MNLEEAETSLHEYRELVAYLDSILSQPGEHSLAESAENRIRELEELKATVAKLRNALEYCRLREHTQSPCDESGSHYSAQCEFCQTIEKALAISTTDSAWIDSLHYTLGLLRSARSYIPDSSIAGSITIPLDKEIKRLEKLLPPEAISGVENAI